jgi:hypothetical protein
MVSMFRAAALVVLLASTAVPALAQTPIWPEIQLRGWAPLAENPNKKFYSKPAPASATNKRLWVRLELLLADTLNGYRYRSSAVLFEVDCAQQAGRVVQGTLYAESNLGGDHTEVGPDKDWRFAVPDTAQEYAQRAACTK